MNIEMLIFSILITLFPISSFGQDKFFRDGEDKFINRNEMNSIGYDPDMYDNLGWTPLFGAADKGHCDMVKTLAMRGDKVNKHDYRGMTVLMVASERCSVDIVKLLIARGADVNAVSKTRDFALMHAVLASCSIFGPGHPEFLENAKELILKGAKVNQRNGEGHTALFSVSMCNNADAIRLLLKNGADAKIKDKDGFTALLNATEFLSWGNKNVKDHVDTVNLLIENGNDVNAMNSHGATPLMLTVVWGVIKKDPIDRKMAIEVANTLISRGANVNIKTHEGTSPLSEAQAHNDVELFTLLKKAGAIN